MHSFTALALTILFTVGHVLSKIASHVKKLLKVAFVPQPPRYAYRKYRIKWWLLRVCWFVALFLVLLDYYILPVIGSTFIQPRGERPPQSPYGLSPVNTLPTQTPPAVDIVFVHGLGSFPDSTWTKSRKFQATDSIANNVNWIRDLLPVDLHAARLLFFNYDSTYYNDAPQKNLEDIADELLDAFNQQRARTTLDELHRPIIFLCHSYGGLVVKEALNRAQRNQSLNHDITRNTYGTIYLGTPHAGTKYARYQKAVAERLHRLGSNPDIFLPLEVNSTQLVAQHKDHLRFFEGQIKVINFYETHKQVIYTTPILRLSVKVMIVDKSSATFTALNTTNMLLDTDHSGMNKYDATENSNYTKILQALRNMMRGILIDRENRRLAEQAEETARLAQAEQELYKERCPSTKHYLVHPQTVASYVERTSLMKQLTRFMEEDNETRSPPRSVALWGSFGAGKSQLALHYAEINRKRFDPIIWVDASSPASAIKSYTNAFRELNLNYPINILDERYKEATSGSHYLSILQEDWIIPTVMRELESRTAEHCRWLVILDSADDVYWLPDLIPRGPQGSVIVISRDMMATDYTNHAIEIDQLTTDEGIDLLLSHVDGHRDNWSTPDLLHHNHIELRKQALPIVEELGHSALLLGLASQLVRGHPYIRENISTYLDYHARSSLSLLNTSHIYPLGSYPSNIATSYETSWDTIHNISTNSTAVLNLLAFLNGGIFEDRLFQEAATSLAVQRKLRSTWLPLLLVLQATLCALGPRIVIGLLIRLCPWTPRFNNAHDVLVRQILVFLPFISDALYLIILLIIERSRLDSGNVVTPKHLLAPYTVITLVYYGIVSTLPEFSMWILQDDKLPWTLSRLPMLYAMSVLLGWAWTIFYYGLDNVLEHHIKALLDRLDLSRVSMFQFEQALVGLRNLSRERLGIDLPGKLAWQVFWDILWRFILDILSFWIITFWYWFCDKVVSLIKRIRNQRWYWKLLQYIILAITHPLGFTFCFMAGYGISSTGILYWHPWTDRFMPEGWVTPVFLNNLLDVSQDDFITWKSFPLEETVRPLIQYSMVHRSPRTGYNMHPLIQWCTRQRLDPAERAAWIAETTRFISLAYHSRNCFNDIFCQQLIIPHLIEIASADVTNDGTQYWRLKEILQMLYRSLKMVGRI